MPPWLSNPWAPTLALAAAGLVNLLLAAILRRREPPAFLAPGIRPRWRRVVSPFTALGILFLLLSLISALVFPALAARNANTAGTLRLFLENDGGYIALALGVPGAALAAWGLWVAYLRAEARSRRCPACGYDMAAIRATRTCPECGKTARRERDLFPARRRRWAVVLGVLLLAAALASPWEIEAALHGPTAILPTGLIVRIVPADARNSAVWAELSRRVQNVRLTPAQTAALRARLHTLISREPGTSLLRGFLLHQLAEFAPSGEDPYAADLVDALANAPTLDRRRIVEALDAYSSLSPVLVDAMVKLLDDPDQTIRMYAYHFAAAHGPPAIVPHLITAIKTRADRVASYAVLRGLSERTDHSPELMNAVFDELALIKSEDSFLKAHLVTYMLRNDPELHSHLPRLYEALPLKGNELVQYLGYLSDLRAALLQPRVLALLHDDLHAPGAANRLAAFKILFALDDNTLPTHRAALLADPDPAVRAEARVLWPQTADAAAVSTPGLPAKP